MCRLGAGGASSTVRVVEFGPKVGVKAGSGSESSSEESEEEEGGKAKGVGGLIETNNPNHVKTAFKKLNTLTLDDKTPASRKER